VDVLAVEGLGDDAALGGQSPVRPPAEPLDERVDRAHVDHCTRRAPAVRPENGCCEFRILLNLGIL
jgi:hypothetical protein